MTKSIHLDCFSVSDVSRNSKILLIPMTIGIIPIKPKTNGGTASESNAANDEIATSIIIPRNCPTITFLANSLGVANNKIRINVSSILEAMNAVTPTPRRPIKSVNNQSFANLVNLIVAKGQYPLVAPSKAMNIR